ncbi:hypothetical protein [Novosphingobium sp.]|uniref:hypothetical protein n=1 Tax=Novosphingobium sp. TaxID=1874826 RepID=UPI0038BA0CB5
MIRAARLARTMAQALRGAAVPTAIDPHRARPWTAHIVAPAEDPLRCRCPECLMLDAMYPGDGYQLALLEAQLATARKASDAALAQAVVAGHKGA